MSKRPKYKIAPVVEKIPRVASDPTSFHEMRPSWRIARMELLDLYGWHSLDSDGVRYVHSKLALFEGMTWREILVVGKRSNHTVSIADLCGEAQRRLRVLGYRDIDELVSLRLSGKERVWGRLSEGVLTVIWWDPNHEVCPSLLRNT